MKTKTWIQNHYRHQKLPTPANKPCINSFKHVTLPLLFPIQTTPQTDKCTIPPSRRAFPCTTAIILKPHQACQVRAARVAQHHSLRASVRIWAWNQVPTIQVKIRRDGLELWRGHDGLIAFKSAVRTCVATGAYRRLPIPATIYTLSWLYVYLKHQTGDTAGCIRQCSLHIPLIDRFLALS